MLLENTENETLSDTFTGLTDHTFINLKKYKKPWTLEVMIEQMRLHNIADYATEPVGASKTATT